MSFGTRTSSRRIYNYTPNLYQNAHMVNQYQQQSFRANNYHPSQQQADEEASSIVPKPINVPSLQDQDQQFVNQLQLQNRNNEYGYHPIPGTGKQGASIKKRVEMGFLSGIEEEVQYALKTLVEFSHSDPTPFAFKTNPTILTSLVGYLDCTMIESDYQSEELAPTQDSIKNTNLSFSLDAALALRNFSQVIENSAVMSMDIKLKEILIKILKTKNLEHYTVGEDNYEASVELLTYSLDIVESISSYLTLSSDEDVLFSSLLSILKKSEDRYIIISILRSLSRLLVRAPTSAASPADSIDSEVLNQISAYLLASSPLVIPDPKTDELLLASIDFIYQYCLAGEERVKLLLADANRALLFKKALPNLLSHGIQTPPTEFTDQLNLKRRLKLVKRIKTLTPSLPPKLDLDLLKELNQMDEPQRATAWMRCCYEPCDSQEVTQISLWKSYESQFARVIAQGETSPKKLLPAVDFIKNVSNAFPNSAAKVIPLDDQGTRKFVITGIQPRQFTVSVEIGDADAVKTPDQNTDMEIDEVEDTIEEGLESSMQKPFKLVNYGDNEKINLNEINTSSALLINCLARTEVGNKLFVSKKDEFLSKVLVTPALFSHIYETLKSLDY